MAIDLSFSCLYSSAFSQMISNFVDCRVGKFRSSGSFFSMLLRLLMMPGRLTPKPSFSSLALKKYRFPDFLNDRWGVGLGWAGARDCSFSLFLSSLQERVLVRERQGCFCISCCGVLSDLTACSVFFCLVMSSLILVSSDSMSLMVSWLSRSLMVCQWRVKNLLCFFIFLRLYQTDINQVHQS